MTRLCAFKDDIGYSAWANLKLLNAGLSAAELEQEMHVSHSNVLATLRHVYDAERVWLDCVRTPDEGIYVLPQEPSLEHSLDELKNHWPKIWEGYCEWIKGLAENVLDSEIILELPNGQHRFSREKILRHILDHSQFHRGQVVAMIRALGHRPPAINRMDYFFDVND